MKVLIFLCAVAVAFAFKEPDVQTCDEKPDGGMCRAYFPMFYFDPDTRTCKKFIYGGCQGNGNRYATEEKCMKKCSNSFVQTCDEKPDGGMCLAYMPMYYFDPETRTCKEFIYGGCQGNGNRYPTEAKCMEKCSTLHALPEACDQEMFVGPCKASISRYYYNKKTGECEEFFYGGCYANDNNFKTEEECEAACER